jgi:hypothetical protein
VFGDQFVCTCCVRDDGIIFAAASKATHGIETPTVTRSTGFARFVFFFERNRRGVSTVLLLKIL